MNSFQSKLIKLGACDEAKVWVGSQTLAKAWRECPRGDWLLWLAARAGVDRRLVVEAACRCAEAVLGLVPEGEERPVRAIEAARAWIRGEASLAEVRAASTSASYAASASGTFDTFYAAYAASAASAAYAAYAASSYDAASAAYDAAASAASAAAAVTSALTDCADLVRQVISVSDLLEVL